MKLLILATAFLLVATPPAAAQGYEPPGTITVTPPTPSPGEAVTVAVTGCTPAPGQVDVLIDEVIVGQADVGPDGSFTEDFLVPLDASGEVRVEVRCANEVLGSFVDVQTPDQPFRQGDSLPRTGTSTTRPLVQVGMALLGLGCLAVLVADRSRRGDGYSPLHGADGPTGDPFDVESYA
jgi:hypothetical protein